MSFVQEQGEGFASTRPPIFGRLLHAASRSQARRISEVWTKSSLYTATGVSIH
jgi:hypothetical protein